LYDGELTIFRTTNSGKVFQLQMWITSEQKYIRKSTRTKNLELAKNTAKQFFKEIQGKLLNAEPVFSKTYLDVCNEYLDEKLKGVGQSRTYERFVTIRSQIKHILNFVGEDTKVTDVAEEKWLGYFEFREKHSPKPVRETLNNEKNNIRTLIRFFVRKRYLPPNYLPEFRDLKFQAPRKREAFTQEDYKTIYRFFRTNKWRKNENLKVVEQREYIKDFAIILLNTGLRFGELRKVQWRNVKIDKAINDETNTGDISVLIKLDGYQTKTGVERSVHGMRGDVFKRLKKFSKYTNLNDYIFVDNDTGKQIERTVYYRHWNFLVRETGLDKRRRDNSFYCFRHTYCTWRLEAGVNVFSLAKNMGTSVSFIEKHYGQTDTENDKKLVEKADLTRMNKFTDEF